MTLNEQAQEILKLAEERGTENNFFFATTFRRYMVQINNLTKLEEEMKTEDATVTKEYVKGRKNVYTNPLYKQYDSTADSANRTVTTLIKIIESFSDDSGDFENDALMKMLKGNG